MYGGEAARSKKGSKDKPLTFPELISSIMYYTNLSKDEILNSSRAYLYELYAKTAYRAAENLGVDPDASIENGNGSGKTKLSESDYPDNMPSFNGITEEALAKSDDPKLDVDFLGQFEGFNPNRYFIDPE